MTQERNRNQDGRWRGKRDDTLIWTIEEEYGIDLWVRSDMELWTYLEQHGYESLSQMLEDKR